ncbi:MAG: geranylgeranylglycerol-phosphate geranylgeranyltransferase [Bacteroidia bacterium]|nr:geranylgeranylglycerol-phosphate geranylgeranyltransferase [Bacteroidia bacterium]
MESVAKTNSFISFLKLIRFGNLLIIAATQYLFEYFILPGEMFHPNRALAQYYETTGTFAPFSYGMQLSHFDFFLLSLSTVMIAAAGYIINDYFDVKTDRINRPDSIVIDRGIKRRVAMAAHTVINFTGIGLGIYVGHKAGNFQLGMIHVIVAGLLWFYSTNFKKMFFVGNVVVAFFTALVPLIVAIYELHLLTLNYNSAYVMNPFFKDFVDNPTYLGMEIEAINFKIPFYSACCLGVFAFLTNLMREIVKDMEDFVGDMETGGKTVPITLGIKATKNIVHVINILTICSLGLISYLLWEKYDDQLSVIYLSTLVCLPLIIFSFLLKNSQNPKKFKKTGMFLKFVMLAGILYSFLVYYNFTKI